MAMEISPSAGTSSDRTQGEMVSQLERSIMPSDLFMAAKQGNGDFLVRHLGLPAEEQNHIQVTVDASELDTDQIQEGNSNVVRYNLESATCFGETILHILIANRHNELAKKVFQKNVTLLKAQNDILQTPLHYAAKVGNAEIIQSFIQLAYLVIKDVLKETDANGETALHLAARYGHKNVVGKLLNLNREVVYKVNKEGLSPLHAAIVGSQTSVVESMLEADNSLACTQFSNGLFPIHVAARKGNTKLLKHLFHNYPDSAELTDPHGRTFFHTAAEGNIIEVFEEEWYKNDALLNKMELCREEFLKNDVMLRMIKVKDHFGNTPLHRAAMMGHRKIMRAICKISDYSSKEANNQGLTPFDCSVIQLTDTKEWDIQTKIERYVSDLGRRFTGKWFYKVMLPSPQKYWERSQLIGLGSVLITTVAFAAAFTIPGGYSSDHGTPILGRRFMFRAFIIADALGFMQAFVSVLSLVGLGAQAELNDYGLGFASYMFVSAANCMVLSFGTGSYVMLSPVCMPLAIIVLVLALVFASPVVFIIFFFPFFFLERLRSRKRTAFIGWYVIPLVFIFCLPFLK